MNSYDSYTFLYYFAFYGWDLTPEKRCGCLLFIQKFLFPCENLATEMDDSFFDTIISNNFFRAKIFK